MRGYPLVLALFIGGLTLTAGAQPAASRAPHARGADVEALLVLGERLGAPGAALEGPPGALDAFFEALDTAARGEGQARITVFGNSLLISDRIVDVWRRDLQARFGNGGRGFLLADRMANYGARSRSAASARGFSAHNVVWGKRGAHPAGMWGAHHVSHAEAAATWGLDGAQRARLFWLDHPRAPPLILSVDGAVVIETTGGAPSAEGRITPVALAPNARTLHLDVRQKGGVIYGVSLERETPGVVLDNLAITGADSTRFLRTDEALFKQQLSALAPDLVTVLLGGNEVKRIAWGYSSPARVRKDLRAFLARIKSTVPQAACLVTGPLENVLGGRPTKRDVPMPKRPWQTRPETEVVNTIMREEALASGCAYLDLFAAFGGRGALKRLAQDDLVNDDMIHPKGRGLDLVGALIDDALLDAYEGACRGAEGHGRLTCGP